MAHSSSTVSSSIISIFLSNSISWKNCVGVRRERNGQSWHTKSKKAWPCDCILNLRIVNEVMERFYMIKIFFRRQNAVVISQGGRLCCWSDMKKRAKHQTGNRTYRERHTSSVFVSRAFFWSFGGVLKVTQRTNSRSWKLPHTCKLTSKPSTIIPGSLPCSLMKSLTSDASLYP